MHRVYNPVKEKWYQYTTEEQARAIALAVGATCKVVMEYNKDGDFAPAKSATGRARKKK